MADAEQSLVNGVTNLSVKESEQSKRDGDEFKRDWGFSLQELYKLAVRFFKEKDGKALKLTYKDKLRLVAYTKQATYGKYRNDVSPEVGFLDVVGNDRSLSTNPSEWQAWQALGDMSQTTAMSEFVKQLDSLCPLFRPFTEAHSAEKQEQERKRQEEEDRLRREAEEKERRKLEEEAQRQLELQKQKQLEQEMQIRAALNQQTAGQFAQYAQQQYPSSKQQQEELIRQLQEQHYQQYMQQVYQQQLLHQQQQYQQMQQQQASNIAPTPTQQTPAQQMAPPPTQQPDGQQTQATLQQQANTVIPNGPIDGTSEKKQEGEDELPPLAAASMWTRKDIKEFKESLQKDKDSVIKIGSGETVTVRVPTHEDGTCLFWEFATDYYDIGFGVYFEWTVSPSTTVSVTVSESSDEEEFDEEQDTKNDVEQGAKKDDRPPTDEIIPVYRRDSHEEVYCGSHAYPGQGVYLLKFDNSYSLWRSKTLYYRVYYSR
ncbi:Golgi resident protein GCP60-like isoform X2 [Ostrea edulis]|uniref:Golgi resident protein GCP60-like isoform X2 n=1 Tax=Ostrea edulis TaxID=37623 RepID=UPI0024AEAADA|nr:Golgi resident protein GCP60-like isoform X2 [Ostrea edulis]